MKRQPQSRYRVSVLSCHILPFRILWRVPHAGARTERNIARRLREVTRTRSRRDGPPCRSSDSAELRRDNDVNAAIRVLKKKMQREGTFREMKRRRSYETNCRQNAY